MSDFEFVAALTLRSSVAVMLAALGELVAERSGILNLGVEGMMLCGALAGFAAGTATGNPWLALGAAMAAGGALSLVHAFFAIRLRVNQLLSGLTITLLGTGLANFLGRPFIGARGIRLADLPVPVLGDIPVLGPVLFRQTPLAYAALVLALLVWYSLFRTRPGLAVRAAGESPAAADVSGVNVGLTRACCTLFGGMLAGLAGAHLSLAYTPGWKETMTGGQGWIAVAMVIFATWNPLRAMGGALLFGGLTALQFYFQTSGLEIVPAWVLRMLPYLLTILVLVLTTASGLARGYAAAPAALGQPFSREE
jgi:simple sugar transport system permease protein